MNTARKKERLPTATLSERVSTYIFLSHMRDRLQESIFEHESEYRKLRTEALSGQLKYMKHQLSTINWLIQINQQRRTDE